jgi:hypothetical protein
MNKILIYVCALALTVGAAAADNVGPRGWTVAGEGVLYRLDSLHHWGRGFGLDIIAPLAGRFSAQLAFMFLPSSNGHYSFRGFAADAGVLYRLAPRTVTVDLAAGVSWASGDDSDGTPVRILGAYVGTMLRVPIGRRLGFTVRPVLRILHQSGVPSRAWTLAPGISAGPGLSF